MTKDRCRRCGGRLRIRSRRCRQCGAGGVNALRAAGEPSGRNRVVRYLVAPLLLIAVLVGAHQVSTFPAFADRYAEFALRHLPLSFSAFAPTDSPTGAYNFCIRQVVRKLTPAASIETFPTSSPQNTFSLGESRYRVESFFHEDRATGERIEHHYRCSVRYAQGRWVLEDLTPIHYARVD